MNYNFADHFSILEGTTVIIGSTDHTGDITLGEMSSVDIGAQNLVAVTARRVDGLDNVISSGIVAELLTQGVTMEPIPDEIFVSPVVTEIEIEQLIRIVTDEEEEERLRRKVSSDEEAPNMCEA